MKVHNCIQGSKEWLSLRAGVPTASEFHRLVSPTWKIRTGDGPTTFLCEKLVEAFTGAPLPQTGGFGAMEQGTILEGEALPWFELEYGPLERVGFCTTDDGRIGCSPDALFGDDSGVEMKAPQAQTHVGYLMAGELPSDYSAQVHGAMLVTGRPTWRFVSYRRGFPPLVLVVRRDEKIQAVLREALNGFIKIFDTELERLKSIAGPCAAQNSAASI